MNYYSRDSSTVWSIQKEKKDRTESIKITTEYIFLGRLSIDLYLLVQLYTVLFWYRNPKASLRASEQTVLSSVLWVGESGEIKEDQSFLCPQNIRLIYAPFFSFICSTDGTQHCSLYHYVCSLPNCPYNK